MSELFLRLLNMSINAGWLVVVILLARQLLKRAPKAIYVGLWALVGIRLLLPVSFESVLSLLPSVHTVPMDILYTQEPKIESGIPVINEVINPVIGGAFAPVPGDSVNPAQVIIGIAANLWLVGIASMMIYAIASYLTLWRKVREAVPEPDGASFAGKGSIRYSDLISTPFILGIVRPRIYLPYSLTREDKAYVIGHETMHLKRRDHWWKPLGYLLLSVYWFNPLLWVAYILLCRDIELACDEKVIREMDVQERKAYSKALINCSASRRLIVACPLAFGEVGVKERIRSVLNYRRPAFWIVTMSVIMCIVLGVCFLSDPLSGGREQTQADEFGATEIPTVPVRYVFKDSVDPLLPSVLLNYHDQGKSFMFTYSGLSSYLPFGTYEIVGDDLILRTEDKTYTYIFKIVEKGLIFDASRSSQIPSYRYSGDSYETECPVPDGALFERELIPLPETENVMSEPPTLKLSGWQFDLEATMGGTYAWNYMDEAGVMHSINADGNTILYDADRMTEIRRNVEDLLLSIDTFAVTLHFTVQPDEVKVLAWRYEGEKSASEEISFTDMSFRMDFGVEVYEVIAKWDTSRYYSGEVHYGFRFSTPEGVPNP